MVLQYRTAITELLVRFGDDVLDAVAAQSGVNVDDVRAKVLGPLREMARRG